MMPHVQSVEMNEDKSASRRRPSRAFIVVVLMVAIIGVVTIAVARFLRAPSSASDHTYIARKVPMTDELRFLQQYVRIDTSNPPGRERAGADFLVSYLKQHGITAELIESAPGRANVYARIKGKQAGGGLLLFHHIDVVPVDARYWSHKPFSGEVADNLLWGRGAIDMKGLAACHLAAFLEVARRGQPQRDVAFLATADEEEGSTLGMNWLVTHRPDLFTGIGFAMTEGGLTPIVGDRVEQMSVEIGSRQFVELRAIASDLATLRRMRIALEPFRDPVDPQRVTPAVRDYFRQVAPTRKTNGALLADIDRTIASGKFWLVDSSYRRATQNTVAAGGAHREGDHYECDIYLGNLPDVNPDQSIAALKAIVEPMGVTLQTKLKMGPSRISSTNGPLYRTIAELTPKYFDGARAYPLFNADSTTDCRFVRSLGVECYGVQNFRVNFFQSKGVHGLNEAVRVDWFVDGVEFTKELVTRFVERQ